MASGERPKGRVSLINQTRGQSRNSLEAPFSDSRSCLVEGGRKNWNGSLTKNRSSKTFGSKKLFWGLLCNLRFGLRWKRNERWNRKRAATNEWWNKMNARVHGDAILFSILDYFCCFSLPLASTRWDWSTISNHWSLSFTQRCWWTFATPTIFLCEKFQEPWDSNPVQLGLEASMLLIVPRCPPSIVDFGLIKVCLKPADYCNFYHEWANHRNKFVLIFVWPYGNFRQRSWNLTMKTKQKKIIICG